MADLTGEQLLAIDRVVTAAGVERSEYVDHVWNVHRWIVAYENNEEDAAQMLRRHMNIREVMGLRRLAESSEEDPNLCSLTDSHAPISILGSNQPIDNKVVLLEMTGKLDIHGLVENMQFTRFMRARFRVMERVQQAVMVEEKASQSLGGALLVMDLEGLSFSPSLLSVIAGAYRIMWGTLFEQYPQLIQRIVIVNAPTFVNVLHSTCIPFIPSSYRVSHNPNQDEAKDKIVICGSRNPEKTLLAHIHSTLLPSQYGGTSSPIPMPISPFPKAKAINLELRNVTIPAGRQVYHKYFLEKDDLLHLYMQNDDEFTLYYFFSSVDTKSESEWREIIAGCERPALPTTDCYKWRIPYEGFYYVRYGNEKAWIMSVTVKVRYDSESKGQLQPIQEWIV